MSAQVYTLSEGRVPLLISMPHNGELIAREIKASMTERGLSVPDTDWCIDLLYDFAKELGVYTIKPSYNRNVIDLNRDPQGVNLYPGAQSTELCPTSCFDFSAIYLAGQLPDEQEVQRRISDYWQPYHQQLSTQLTQMQQQYGIAILLDAHSIRSEVQRFFSGQLPDFNFGTVDGASCSRELQSHLDDFCCAPYSQISNGRFKGGYITRAYGQPQQNIHAIQLELSQRTYMHEATAVYAEEKALAVKKVLRALVLHLLDFAQQNSRSTDIEK
ncbi:MAG: N-formylglutamate deformylase [Osedax symbiont Rs1]|nr:MAG: N-formylglutamate deformylase [Osedax symbiont Rs1]